jgi:ATP-dependent DNA helicase RecQ
VLRYFGDEHELLGGCGHCDVCASIDDDEPALASTETSTLVRKALAGVARAQKRAGLQAIAEMLHGLDTERTRRFGFTQLSTFGLFADREHEWIVAMLRGLMAAGWVDLTPTEHPVPFLTKAGGDVMRGTDAVRFVVPQLRARRARSSEASPRKKGSAADSLDASLRPLFEHLRAHRAEIARARAVPAYVIALDRTLVELAEGRPRTLDDLHAIHGFGPSRIEQYGQSFLDALSSFDESRGA